MLRITGLRKFTSSLVSKDLVKDLYLSELRQYVAPKAVVPDLKDTVNVPKPPAKPELDGKDVPFASASEVVLTESGWPTIPDIVEEAENWDSNSMNGSSM